MWLFTYSGLMFCPQNRKLQFLWGNLIIREMYVDLILHALVAISALLPFLKLCGLSPNNFKESWRFNQELVCHQISEKWAFPGLSSAFKTL